MNTDVEPLDVKGLKHNFGHVFSVLGWVEWRLGENNYSFFRITS